MHCMFYNETWKYIFQTAVSEGQLKRKYVSLNKIYEVNEFKKINRSSQNRNLEACIHLINIYVIGYTYNALLSFLNPFPTLLIYNNVDDQEKIQDLWTHDTSTEGDWYIILYYMHRKSVSPIIL